MSLKRAATRQRVSLICFEAAWQETLPRSTGNEAVRLHEDVWSGEQVASADRPMRTRRGVRSHFTATRASCSFCPYLSSESADVYRPTFMPLFTPNLQNRIISIINWMVQIWLTDRLLGDISSVLLLDRCCCCWWFGGTCDPVWLRGFFSEGLERQRNVDLNVESNGLSLSRTLAPAGLVNKRLRPSPPGRTGVKFLHVHLHVLLS